MNDELETLFHQAKQDGLNREEREVLRSRLVEFMRIQPVRNLQDGRQLDSRRVGERGFSTLPERPWRQIVLSFLKKPMPIVAVILSIVLTLGGGVSFAAEQTVPGDILYPVKVSVNEEVKSALTFSSEGKAEWEARRVERRLEEAQELNANGTLNSEVRAALSQQIQAHVERAEEGAREAEDQGDVQIAADINSRVEAAFGTHIQILNILLDRVGEEGAVKIEMEGLKVELERKRGEAKELRVEIESRVRIQANEALQKSAEAAKKSAESKIDEVRKFLEKQKQRLGAEAVAGAEARLKVAEGTYADAKAKLDAKAYLESFSLFRSAHQQAQEAKLLSDLSKNLNIDLDVRFDDDDDEDNSSELKGVIRSNKEVKVNVNGVEVKGSGMIEINGEDIQILPLNSRSVKDRGENEDDDNNEDGLEVEVKGNGGGVFIQSNTSITGTGTVIQNTRTSIKSESKVEYRSE